MSEETENTVTELLYADVAKFPRAKLTVVKGPDKGKRVVLEGQTVRVGSEPSSQLQLTDSAVSRRHFELSGGPDGYKLRDLKSTNGVFVDGVEVLEARLKRRARISLGRTELEFAPEAEQVEWPLSPRDRLGECVGRSAAMRRVFAVLEKAAPSDSPVLFEGEAGTGKEALARAVHAKSKRIEGPFVVMDFGALSEQLMETDLFGVDLPPSAPGQRRARQGALEEADGGTLFLDDIHALPLALQMKLLRALETMELRRGPGQPIRFNVRIIAASSADLETEVKEGRFRQDLFYFLSVFRVVVPPLRDRLEDVPMLARSFEAKLKGGHPLSAESIALLQAHDWPGNVRELRNVVERLCAMPDLGANAVARALGKQNAGVAVPTEEPAAVAKELDSQLLALPYHEAKERVLVSFERSYFTEHLRSAGGVVTRTAQRVGLPRQSLHRMLRRLGLHSGEE